MIDKNEVFSRAKLLFGEKTMQRLAEVKILLFGCGGVGSWCAESLIRSGLEHLTIVDFDVIVPSNINRQLMATSKTVGMLKVDALRTRLLDINPDAKITAINGRYPFGEHFNDFENFDYIVDCIDSIADKFRLIINATASSAKFFSSMGAALRLDPTKVKVSEFRKVEGDALARALRHRMKQNQTFPTSKFMCVYSEEPASKNRVENSDANGSLIQVTATFGLTLSSLIIKDIYIKN